MEYHVRSIRKSVFFISQIDFRFTVFNQTHIFTLEPIHQSWNRVSFHDPTTLTPLTQWPVWPRLDSGLGWPKWRDCLHSATRSGPSWSGGSILTQWPVLFMWFKSINAVICRTPSEVRFALSSGSSGGPVQKSMRMIQWPVSVLICTSVKLTK